MGNLTGANFRDWVKNQINVRQTKLALQNRDNETLVWSNGKTSWLRMVSSVSVTAEKSKELTGDENYSGRKLAQNYVLFGGVVNSEGDQPILKQGIATSVSPDSSPLTNNIYGFNETRGLSPAPGLTNASIKAMNRGALKQAEIQFVAQNKEQFKILDALYMRPGFTILLEWGHTLYFDNDSILQRASYNTKPFEIFKTGKYKENKPNQSAQQVILEEIDKHRESTDGNYDGFYGKITNFDWTLNTDGTYNIKIRAISIGDIIESLNISRPLPSKDEDSDNEEINSIVARRDKSKLDRWLYFRYNDVVTRDKIRRPTSSSTDEIKAQISYVGDSGINRETLAYYPNKGEKKVYMKLGVLLKYINDNLLIVNSQNQNYISIDFDFDSNLCTTHPFQFSADPDICVIPFYSPKLNGGAFDFNTKNTSYFNQITLENFRQTDSDYVGKLMHIHVNIDYITSVIESSTDEETQSLYLQSFLQNLMNGIQGALGGINKFTVSYNNEENLIKIYDDVPLDPKVTKTNEGEVATFRAFGVEPGIQGSFVTNVSLNATISPDFATMISIGAQANGTNDITNATALTKFNKGLTDSITPVKQSTDTTEKETPESRLSKNYSKFMSNGGLIFEFYFRADPATKVIPSSKDLNAQFNKYLTSYLSVNKKVPSTQGFIPFDLGLEMEGIAGPRIYEKFSISGDILPSSYPQNLAFLIKGLNHTIDAKGWSTTIDSLSYEAPNEQAIPVVDKVPESPTPTTPPEEDTPPPTQGEFRTITSNLLIKNGKNGPFFFADKTSNKKQITIHFTAGGPSVSANVNWWNILHEKNGFHISTHYLIGGNGEKELLFPLENYSNHTGVGGSSKNKYNVGIEVCNYGWANERSWWSPKANLIDKNGNPIPSYRGKSDYQSITSSQISTLRQTILEIHNKYPNIPLSFNYDAMFPDPSTYTPAIDGAPGIYTHNSFKPKGQKWDVAPQKELIEMLKSLG
jgi:hypothetical protein